MTEHTEPRVRVDESPERIYLEPAVPTPEGHPGYARCWCQDRIEDDWTEYVRVDLVEPTPPLEADVEARLAEIRKRWEARRGLHDGADVAWLTDLVDRLKAENEAMAEWIRARVAVWEAKAP